MPVSNKDKLKYIGIGLVIVFIIFFWPNDQYYDGESIVNVFPDNDSVKNYELEANIEVKNSYFGMGMFNSSYSYDVQQIRWPNGGYSGL